MTRMPLITIVEHDPMLGMLLLEVLTEEGYAVELWTERAWALRVIRRTSAGSGDPRALAAAAR